MIIRYLNPEGLVSWGMRLLECRTFFCLLYGPKPSTEYGALELRV